MLHHNSAAWHVTCTMAVHVAPWQWQVHHIRARTFEPRVHTTHASWQRQTSLCSAAARSSHSSVEHSAVLLPAAETSLRHGGAGSSSSGTLRGRRLDKRKRFQTGDSKNAGRWLPIQHTQQWVVHRTNAERSGALTWGLSEGLSVRLLGGEPELTPMAGLSFASGLGLSGLGSSSLCLRVTPFAHWRHQRQRWELITPSLARTGLAQPAGVAAGPSCH
jgi:hypothetical protein